MARILITGSSGGLGGKLVPFLRDQQHDLVLLDLTQDERLGVMPVDLADWHGDWQHHFDNVDYVVHLAGQSDPQASWENVNRLNVQLSMNVFEAAVRAGVKRLVFASSNWVLAGHRITEKPLDSNTAALPLTPYGTSKLVGETIGRFYSDVHDLSVICLRIGYNQRLNKAGLHLAWGQWGQEMWLSDGDLLRGIDCAIHAPPVTRFATVNLVSDNAGMRWSLKEAASQIGYVPADCTTPQSTDATMQGDDAAKLIRRQINELEALLMRQRW